MMPMVLRCLCFAVMAAPVIAWGIFLIGHTLGWWDKARDAEDTQPVDSRDRGHQ